MNTAMAPRYHACFAARCFIPVKVLRMSTQIGVGFSDLSDSRAAGISAAQSALANAGTTRADFALLFSTGKHDPQRLSDGVRETLGAGCRIFGGYGVGIITRDHLAYDGFEVGIAVFCSDSLKLHAFVETGLANQESATGEKLGSQLAAANLPADASLLLFYDTVNLTSGSLQLNMATALVAGMAKHLPQWPVMAGMGMLGDMQLHETFQWFDGRVLQQSAMALAFSGGVKMDTIIMHGCRPTGRYHTITKTDGAVVLEIDGKPALQMIHEMLGPDSGLTPEDYSFFVTLGVNKGDRYGTFREDDYANRLCIGVDTARQGLIMFENDLQPGMLVQLMRRALDFSYIGPRTRELVIRAAGRKPLFAFYIDCAGRAAAYCGMDEEEAVEVQRALPPGVPLLGVYSGVELAKVGGAVQALDWTGVLCLFSE